MDGKYEHDKRYEHVDKQLKTIHNVLKRLRQALNRPAFGDGEPDSSAIAGDQNRSTRLDTPSLTIGQGTMDVDKPGPSRNRCLADPEGEKKTKQQKKQASKPNNISDHTGLNPVMAKKKPSQQVRKERKALKLKLSSSTSTSNSSHAIDADIKILIGLWSIKSSEKMEEQLFQMASKYCNKLKPGDQSLHADVESLKKTLQDHENKISLMGKRMFSDEANSQTASTLPDFTIQKGTNEVADTVICCSLRCDHVTFNKELDGKNTNFEQLRCRMKYIVEKYYYVVTNEKSLARVSELDDTFVPVEVDEVSTQMIPEVVQKDAVSIDTKQSSNKLEKEGTTQEQKKLKSMADELKESVETVKIKIPTHYKLPENSSTTAQKEKDSNDNKTTESADAFSEKYTKAKTLRKIKKPKKDTVKATNNIVTVYPVAPKLSGMIITQNGNEAYACKSKIYNEHVYKFHKKSGTASSYICSNCKTLYNRHKKDAVLMRAAPQALKAYKLTDANADEKQLIDDPDEYSHLCTLTVDNKKTSEQCLYDQIRRAGNTIRYNTAGNTGADCIQLAQQMKVSRRVGDGLGRSKENVMFTVLKEDLEDPMVFIGDVNNMRCIHDADYLVCDGTFAYCPQPFDQLYVIMAVFQDGIERASAIPSGFFLCKSKRKNKSPPNSTYSIMWKEVKRRLLEEFGSISKSDSKTVITDREMASMAALLEEIPDWKISNCQFHKAKNMLLNFKQKVTSEKNLLLDDEVKSWFNRLIGLSFLPESVAVEAGNHLLSQYSTTAGITNHKTYKDLAAFRAYYFSTWHSKHGRHFNFYDDPLKPKTTNYCEGFNSGLKKIGMPKHPPTRMGYEQYRQILERAGVLYTHPKQGIMVNKERIGKRLPAEVKKDLLLKKWREGQEAFVKECEKNDVDVRLDAWLRYAAACACRTNPFKKIEDPDIRDQREEYIKEVVNQVGADNEIDVGSQATTTKVVSTSKERPPLPKFDENDEDDN
ncbi:unnamed protein product [Bursaphelenchus okinawaensis]|uniref:MULE domain-containing protein n=1 Tax=Bursaphelenchus okinawaensis TaxID=465554 RepID=A0A811JQ92_9BILA|nr:unnamed protein product [Bursaphelenchus okinawaensis]CAG9076843.1 unnamed protein product [Bursaphelenchus okinawaensis]